MTLPDVIVLDVHGVVFNNPLPGFLAELGDRTGVGAQRMIEVWRSTWRIPFWEGRITPTDLWAGLAPDLDADELRDDLERRYSPGPLFHLLGDYDGRIWLLSNHRTEWLMPRLGRFDIADRFERVVVSDALGAAKPSRAAFAPLVGEASLVYFDDSQRNVAAARSLGVDAHFVSESIHDIDAALEAAGLRPTGR